jgi:hypothetical protein
VLCRSYPDFAQKWDKGLSIILVTIFIVTFPVSSWIIITDPTSEDSMTARIHFEREKGVRVIAQKTTANITAALKEQGTDVTTPQIQKYIKDVSECVASNAFLDFSDSDILHFADPDSPSKVELSEKIDRNVNVSSDACTKQGLQEAEKLPEKEDAAAQKKDIGDYVCQMDGSPLGYVENARNGKLQIRVHHHESGDFSFANGSTPGRDYDTMIWVNYNDVGLCKSPD